MRGVIEGFGVQYEGHRATDLGEQPNWARKMKPSKLVKLYTAWQSRLN